MQHIQDYLQIVQFMLQYTLHTYYSCMEKEYKDVNINGKSYDANNFFSNLESIMQIKVLLMDILEESRESM